MNSQLIDVAIGLTLAFFVVSLVASGAVEMGATITKKRANDLERTMNKLLTGDLAAELKQTSAYKALLIATNKGKDGKERKPSYVAARTFADATIEMLAKEKARVEASVDGARDVADMVKNSPLGDRLVAITAEVGENLTAVKAEIESWFDSAMERLQGAYQRWARWCLFGVGLGIAVLLNVSATHMALRLADDHVVRELVVASADRIVTEQGADGSGVVTPITIDQIAAELDGADELSLPIGWSNAGEWSLGRWGVNAVGWVITALMTMLGAQFWFDAMKRLTTLRGGSGTGGSRPPTAANDPASALSTTTSPFEAGGLETATPRSFARTAEESLNAVIPVGKAPASVSGQNATPPRPSPDELHAGDSGDENTALDTESGPGTEPT